MPSIFSAALGKDLVRRVSEEIHSANIKTLDKFEDSGSVGFSATKDRGDEESIFKRAPHVSQRSLFFNVLHMHFQEAYFFYIAHLLKKRPI